jgi:glycosyltransferase involved in cell wall biosynthesis
MSDLSFSILLAYYKRPKIVLNALESIKTMKYSNWKLFFIDDSGDDSFKEALFNYGLDNDKVVYIPSFETDGMKIAQGGSRHGHYLNECIKNHNSDVIITLCDDDALFPDYLQNLNNFYLNNPNEVWAYSHVKFFNPEIEKYTQAIDFPKNRQINFPYLNVHVTKIAPPNRLDGSQISFRRRAFTEPNLWYPYPQTQNLDFSLFQKFTNFWGLCPFSGCCGIYKGWFENQLGVRRVLK